MTNTAMKWLVSISITFNLVMGMYIWLNQSTSEESVSFIASAQELECLESWHQKDYNKASLSGPFYFEDLYIVNVSGDQAKGSFESNFSGCFYDTFSQINDGISGLESSYGLMKHRGIENIGFYKSPYDSKIILFAKQ